MKKYILLSFLLVLLSIDCLSQIHNLPEPQMAEDTTGVPPPPGLVVSIDKNSHLLLAAGIVFGIFIIRKKKK